MRPAGPLADDPGAWRLPGSSPRTLELINSRAAPGGKHELLHGKDCDNEGYAKPWLLLADESLSGIVQKAGDTPYRVIGNGFSKR
jgi:hypothetical protein